MRRKVLVDLDTGTDDATALVMLLAADARDEICLLGVTCVSGNTDLDNVCRNTLRLLRAANRLDVPVFAGAECSLVAERRVSGCSQYHGEDGFGDLSYDDDLNELDALLQRESAVLAMNRLISENPGEVTLVCLAPLTNVALALRTFPKFKGKIKEIHMMGGNIKGRGNVTPTGEFNFTADPEAAHIVLETAVCPIQMVPWETCTMHPLPVDWRLSSLGAEPERAGSRAMALLNAADRAVCERLNLTEWVCCDAMSVACFLRPSLVLRTHRVHATVELGGSRTRGQMVPVGRTCLEHGLDKRGSGASNDSADDSSTWNVRVVDEFNVEGFQQALMWAAEHCS